MACLSSLPDVHPDIFSLVHFGSPASIHQDSHHFHEGKYDSITGQQDDVAEEEPSATEEAQPLQAAAVDESINRPRNNSQDDEADMFGDDYGGADESADKGAGDSPDVHQVQQVGGEDDSISPGHSSHDFDVDEFGRQSWI